eukprot:5140399-Prymnesium_polylepis.1
MAITKLRSECVRLLWGSLPCDWRTLRLRFGASVHVPALRRAPRGPAARRVDAHMRATRRVASSHRARPVLHLWTLHRRAETLVAITGSPRLVALRSLGHHRCRKYHIL